jgi:hypothetical protein
MSDDCVQHYELEWVQEQIWELECKVRELEMENTLLRNDLNTIKNEGCWRFYENPEHQHKSERPQGAADYEADKRNADWGSYEDDKRRGLVD